MDDRDTLANLIDPNALELDTYPWPRDAADRMLASDWLAARDARVKAETLELAADMCDQRARELSDAATSIDDDYSQFLYEIAVDIREQKVCADEERNHE